MHTAACCVQSIFHYHRNLFVPPALQLLDIWVKLDWVERLGQQAACEVKNRAHFSRSALINQTKTHTRIQAGNKHAHSHSLSIQWARLRVGRWLLTENTGWTAAKGGRLTVKFNAGSTGRPRGRKNTLTVNGTDWKQMEIVFSGDYRTHCWSKDFHFYELLPGIS